MTNRSSSTDPDKELLRCLTSISFQLLAIRNIAVCTDDGDDAPHIVGIQAMAEKAGALADRCLEIKGGDQIVGDWADWEKLRAGTEVVAPQKR